MPSTLCTRATTITAWYGLDALPGGSVTKAMTRYSLAIAMLLLAACSRGGQEAGDNQAEAKLPGPTELKTPDGGNAGMVTLSEDGKGVTVKVEGAGLQPGPHGLHLHAVGRCEGPKFESAGPHWNPASRKHGLSNPAGPHGGDLPNVTVAANGVLSTIVTVPGASLAAGTGSLADGDGAARVIHASADDNVTDPSGNSGHRTACAILVPSPTGS